MRKKSVMAVLLAVCMVTAICGCSSGKDEDVFTGDTPEVPEWQANLDAITPAVYADIDDLAAVAVNGVIYSAANGLDASVYGDA